MRSVWHPISRLRDFTRSCGKTSVCLVDRRPEYCAQCHYKSSANLEYHRTPNHSAIWMENKAGSSWLWKKDSYCYTATDNVWTSGLGWKRFCHFQIWLVFIPEYPVEIINYKYAANLDQPCTMMKMLFQPSIYHIHEVATQNNSELCWSFVLTKADFSSKCDFLVIIPDSKVHGANMGPIWGRQVPGGHHVGPMKFAIWNGLCLWLVYICDPDKWTYWVHYHLRRTCGNGGISHPLLKPISCWLPYIN